MPVYLSDLPFITPDADGILRLNRGTTKQSQSGGSAVEPLLSGARINIGKSIASASTITIPADADAVLITGMRAITRIEGGSQGRIVRLYFESAGVRISGPNLQIDDTIYYSQIGSSLSLLRWDSTLWREWGRTGVRGGLQTFLYHSGDRSIPNDTFTTLGNAPNPWLSYLDPDPGGLWNPANPQNIIDSCPVSSFYDIGGVIKWGSNTVGHRNIATYIVQTDKTDNVRSDAPDPDADFHQGFHTRKYFAKGSTVRIKVEQKSGAPLDVIGQSGTDTVIYANLVGAVYGQPPP